MQDGLLVTYGSQNGTAQDYAETVYLKAMAEGGFQVRLLTLNEYRRVWVSLVDGGGMNRHLTIHSGARLAN